MIMIPTHPPADKLRSGIREFLSPGSKLYSSYVHLVGPGQSMLYEYCNVSGGKQRITALILTAEGHAIDGLTPKISHLDAADILQIDVRQWAGMTLPSAFAGQLVLLVDQASQERRVILPAITAHWISPANHCEIATAAFDKVNLPSFKNKKSFYMYCPLAASDARRETIVVLFNHSTDPDYEDYAEIETALFGMDGERVDGALRVIPPFGALILNLREHFGAAGEDVFARNSGRGSFTAYHLGHTLPAFFFHIDRATRDVLSGQHAQPPISALNARTGVWWGKLRQFGF